MDSPIELGTWLTESSGVPGNEAQPRYQVDD
jgi:hypothetical protein